MCSVVCLWIFVLHFLPDTDSCTSVLVRTLIDIMHSLAPHSYLNPESKSKTFSSSFKKMISLHQNVWTLSETLHSCLSKFTSSSVSSTYMAPLFNPEILKSLTRPLARGEFSECSPAVLLSLSHTASPFGQFQEIIRRSVHVWKQLLQSSHSIFLSISVIVREQKWTHSLQI